MKELIGAYRFINLLSIDIAAGAAIGAAFFAQILQANLFVQAYVVLALTVWIIYTSDHLLDAWRLKGPASTPRHLLHQKHFRLLALLVVLACIVAFVIALFIRIHLMIPGLIMAMACAVYLVLNRWLRYAKELMAAALYSGGVLLPSLALKPHIDYHQSLLVIMFVLVVLINLLLFARMSYDSDLADRHQSFVTVTGPRVTSAVIIALFVCFWIISAGALSSRYFVEAGILSAMCFVLLVIFFFPRYFRSGERYRLVGDSVFLFPAVLLFVS
jgi:hypothetical protein